MKYSSPQLFDIGYVIDDSVISCTSHALILKKSHPELPIKKFSKPIFGLAHLKRDLNEGHRILLLLDIEMPKLKGPELLRYILKQNYLNSSGLKVIFISSAIDKYRYDPVLSNNVVADRAFKPFNLKRLQGILENIFDKVALEIAESA